MKCHISGCAPARKRLGSRAPTLTKYVHWLFLFAVTRHYHIFSANINTKGHIDERDSKQDRKQHNHKTNI